MAKSDRVVAEEVRRPVPVVGARRSELMWTFFSGASVGFVVWIVALLLERYVFSSFLCGGVTGGCSDATSYAGVVAIIVGSIAGLVMLTTTQVYRPLLVVIAAALSLWGIASAVGDMRWYWAMLLSMALFGVAYAAFAWFARIRNFVMALVVLVVIVVLARLALSS